MSYIFLSKKINRKLLKLDEKEEYKIDKTLDNQITTLKSNKLYNYKDLISNITINKKEIDEISSNKSINNIKEPILEEPREI